MVRQTLFCNTLSVLFVVLTVLSGCSTVPISNRQRVNLIPDAFINSMSLTSYNQFLSEATLSEDKKKTAMVKKVGSRIRKAVEDYFEMEGREDLLAGYEWEFNLVQADQVNAWAMPGGKVVVYSGLLQVAQTEADLAVVMGHEIAHAIAKHGSERMTQQLGVTAGLMVLDQMTREEEEEKRAIFMTAYGLGSQVGVLLPFSRKHESEADELGLIFMAMAGYDPERAISFWERMAAMSKGDAPPEFLSTHPSHDTRIRDIETIYLPKATIYYTGN